MKPMFSPRVEPAGAKDRSGRPSSSTLTHRESQRSRFPRFAAPGFAAVLLTAGAQAALSPAPTPGARPWNGPTLPSLEVKNAGLSPEEAAKAMVLPPGFSAKLFAGEPDVKQPIAFAIDDRGRLWVAENYTYPVHAPEGRGKDRILIFEDTDGDGKFDKRTVFTEGLNMVTGLEVGFGGVWVGAAPYLMFIPIREGEDKPDGPPKILLDGWAWQDTHETLNTFTWGPDGWLYGCHGVFTHSNVGKPGAPDSQRTRINAGVWRYHPTRKVFEVFAEGTSNPWGLDFDEHGQCFIEACVIPHLYHVIQGGHYQRQAGQDFNPYVYDDIKTIADHLHYRGNQWNTNDVKSSSQLGGGHAHAGLMIYQGGSWPEDYRGQIFMNNIHGSRINMDIPERAGSGFVGHHGPDFINFNDSWSQIINLAYDQNGSVYLIDWYDKNQCHQNNPDAHDRSNGRIFKVVYHDQKTTSVDLQMKLEGELTDLMMSNNEWYARHAQRVLQERGGDRSIHASLLRILRRAPDDRHKLRALWALHVTGGLTEKLALSELKNRSESVRAWVIQLLCESRNPPAEALKEFALLARTDPSPIVRLYLAAALQRLPAEQRPEILGALLAHSEDASDHNLPLMYWYATEPVVAQNPAQAVALMSGTKIPLVREFITRRMASSTKAAPANAR